MSGGAESKDLSPTSRRVFSWIALALCTFTAGAVERSESSLPKLAALVTEHSSPRSVLETLGSPDHVFIPSPSVGWDGKTDEVVYRFDSVLLIGGRHEADVWVVFGSQGTLVRAVNVSFFHRKTQAPNKAEILASLGKPDRVVHGCWIGEADAEELELSRCDSITGPVEIWLYREGYELRFLDGSDAVSSVLINVPSSIGTLYPKCLPAKDPKPN